MSRAEAQQPGDVVEHAPFHSFNAMVHHRERHQEHEQGLAQRHLAAANGLKPGHTGRHIKRRFRAALEQFNGALALGIGQAHLPDDHFGVIDFPLGNPSIGLGQVTQQQEDGLEKPVLDARDILGRMRFHGAPQAAVKLVAEKQANQQADGTTKQQAEQARHHFAVKHTAPAAGSLRRRD